MANQDISLNNYDPEAAKIQRQQRLAQILQDQAQSDIPINSYNGIQAPISPFSVLAKALQGYNARKLADQSDTALGDLQAKRRTDLAGMLSKQYQVPGQAAQGVNAPNIGSGATGYDTTQGGISDATAARPTTPQEQLANSLSMMSSSNPMAQQMGQPLYKDALEKQQTAQTLGSLDLSSLPTRVVPILKAQIAQGDTAGALKTYGDATKPQVVGGNVLTPTATGYNTTFEAKPAGVQEYEYAQQHGFKGSLTDYQKSKAQATHITVDAGAHGWQVAVDPTTQTQYRYNPNTGQSTSLDGSAPYTPGGYGKVSGQNARTPVGIYMEKWKAENPHASAQDTMSAMNMFTGQQSTARTLGGIEGKVGSAANGLDIMAGQANEAYNKLGKAGFVPFNRLQQMAANNVWSDPAQADAYAADTGVINLWGKAINPNGVLTVEAQRRGEQMLSQAQSPEAHAAVLARMVKESRASKAGITQSQQSIGVPQTANAAPAPDAVPKVVHWNDLK